MATVLPIKKARTWEDAMKLTRRVRFATLMTVAPLVPAALLWSHYRSHTVAQASMRIEVSLSDRVLKVVRDGDVYAVGRRCSLLL